MNKHELLNKKSTLTYLNLCNNTIYYYLKDIIKSNTENKEELINILFEYPSELMYYHKELYYNQCLFAYLKENNNIDESKIDFTEVFKYVHSENEITGFTEESVKNLTNKINHFKLKKNQEKFSENFKLNIETHALNKKIILLNEKKFNSLINREKDFLIKTIINLKYELLELNEDLKDNIRIMSFIIKHIKKSFSEDSIENREYYNNLLGDKLKKILNINEKSTVQNILNTIEKESTYINQKINQYKINELKNKKEIKNKKPDNIIKEENNIIIDTNNLNKYVYDKDVKEYIEKIIKNIDIINKSNAFGLHDYQVKELIKKIEKDLPFLLDTANKLELVNKNLGTETLETKNIKIFNMNKVNIELENIVIKIKENLNLEFNLKTNELNNNQIIIDENKLKLDKLKIS